MTSIHDPGGRPPQLDEALRIARCEEHADRPLLRRIAWAVLKAARGQSIRQAALGRLRCGEEARA